jgi:general secretion pathway protein A
MYQQFFQFRRLPFQPTPDPHFFFFTNRHEEAFNQGLYTVRERKGFMVLTGEVGTGKTTLSRLLIEQLGPRVKSALVFNPNLSTVELLQSINHDFGINGRSYSKKILTDELNQFLLEQLAQGGNATLIIDEAQTLSVDCLEEVRLLSNLETPRAKLLQILLIGQPELMDKLALPQLRQLNQRIVIRAHLAPLEPQEVADYIHYRLWRAGGREAVHFEPAALELVDRYSGGVPRLINALCDRALLAAYVRGTRLISGYLMNQAIGELTPILPVTEPPPAYLTQEEPVLAARTRSDPTLLVAVIGLVLLLAGLGAMWWNSDSIVQRFPTALLAREEPETVLPHPVEFSSGPEPFVGMTTSPEQAASEASSDTSPDTSPDASQVTSPETSQNASPQAITKASPPAPIHLPLNMPRVEGTSPRPATSMPSVMIPPASLSASTPVTAPVTSSVRLPLFPTEVVPPSQPAPGSAANERPAAPRGSSSSDPATMAPTKAAPLELKSDHVDTRVAAVDREAVIPPSVEPAPTALRVPRAVMPSTVDGEGGAAWYVDGDDVIRAATPELMERAALLMLLHQWGAVPGWPPARPNGLADADPATLARERRLELLQVPLSGHELLKLDYPAIVMRKGDTPERPPRPVVISRTIDGRVVILDPGAGSVTLSAAEIDQDLTGVVRLYWRPLNDWRWPGPVDGEDPVVQWLQRQLHEQRMYRGPIDGLVGPDTEQALLQWAGQRGLTVTVGDPLMDLLISQLLAPSDFPHLSPHDSGPSTGQGRAGDVPAAAAGRAAG